MRLGQRPGAWGVKAASTEKCIFPITGESVMKKLIATLIAATFAAFTFTAFAAEESKPTDKPAAEKKHQKKKHKEMHKEEAKEGAGEKK
jgi:hypothetical protein